MQKKNKKQEDSDYKGHYEPRKFPKGFLWGTATSSYQVEGGNYNSDWSHWENKGGKIEDGTTCGEAVDNWNRYKEDFKILDEQLHNNAYRMSVEWSRLEPEEGSFNEEAFIHYKEMLKELKKRGITIMLTLHHFTNPEWLAKQNSWEKRAVIKKFLRFTEEVYKELGDYVDLWVTINEPMVYAMQGYVSLEWPPQKASKYKAAKVVWIMARAHKKAYKLIHKLAKEKGKTAKVGIANNVSSFHVYQKHSFSAQIFVAIADRASNHLFYTLSGRKTHDFLGLNYYFHMRIKTVRQFLGAAFSKEETDSQEKFESSDIGWELFPHGIFDVCVDLASYKKPIYITENGLATSNDDKRIRVIVGYLMQLHHAIEAGADIRGYFHWSLLDNFEWAKGFKPTFGLIGVDRETQERTVRPSAEVYSYIAKDNAIKHDFLQFLGHGTKGILEAWKKKHKDE